MSKQYKLKEMRDKYHYTQGDIAIKLGISTRTYANKENGSSEFTLSEAKKIATIFNANIYEIFFTNEVNKLNTLLLSTNIET